MAVSDPRIMEHMFSEIGLVGEERTQQQGSNPLQVGLKALHSEEWCLKTIGPHDQNFGITQQRSHRAEHPSITSGPT